MVLAHRAGLEHGIVDRDGGIGEGDSVVDRIKSHAKDASKDFWTRACLVTSKDMNLTKAHVRYLENRFIDLPHWTATPKAT